MISIDYLFITHRIYYDGKAKVGGLDRTKEYLLEKGHTIGYIENPLTTFGPELSGGYISRLSVLKGATCDTVAEFKVRPQSEPWRWVTEPFYSTALARKHFTAGYVCLAGDPLSSLHSLMLRGSGHAACSIMHCTDFAEKRFGNPIINKAYLDIYRRSIRKCDFVLCITKRMQVQFSKWEPNREYTYFPNTPDARGMPVVAAGERRRNRIVLMGPNETGMHHEMLASGVRRLNESGARMEILVLGAGRAVDVIREAAARHGVEGSLSTPGYLDRGKALKLVAESGMGIVLYNGQDSYNFFRDSLKIREYAACGLPSICDPSTETAEEGQKAGACILVRNEDEFVRAVETLQDAATYAKMSEAALDWARRNDKRKYLDELYARVELSRMTTK